MTIGMSLKHPAWAIAGLAMLGLGACFPDINLKDELDSGAASGSLDGGALPGSQNGLSGNDSTAPDPNDKTPPAFTAPTGGCLAHETSASSLCIGATSFGAALRFATSEPAKASASLDGVTLVAEQAFGTQHWLAVGPLAPGSSCSLDLKAADASGNAGSASVPITTAAARPPVVLTEVLVDPKGPEPAQEFVELYNLGDAGVDLEGWMIDDSGDRNGDLLPAATLGPGQVGLIVSDAYDSASTEDPHPDSSAVMIQVSGSIATSGLKNDTGETVELYDAAGALVSRFPNLLGKHVEGRSAERVSPFAPDEDPSNWRWNPNGSSSPGQVAW